MTDPKAFADHMSRVLAGILVEVTECFYERESLHEGRDHIEAADKALNAIGSDAGLALTQAIAHQKELGGEPFGHHLRKHGLQEDETP